MAKLKIDAAGAYTEGSAARQLEPMPSRLPKDPALRPKQKLVPKPQSKRNYFKLAVAAGIVALAIGAVVSLSQLMAVRTENAALMDQLGAVNAERYEVMAKVDSIITPESVEIYARGHRMTMPSAGQMVAVAVPAE